MSFHAIAEQPVAFIPNEHLEPEVNDKPLCDIILKSLGKFADAVYRAGITLTGILPFSSRGIILNLVLAPFFIPIRLIQSAISDSKFTDKMNEYMDRDWNQGIQDFYIDLESPDNADLRKQVVDENFRYVAYMSSDYFYEGAEHGALPHMNQANGPLAAFREKLEKMNYKHSHSCNYYNTKTGNIFKLVLDKERNELIICFRGLGSEQGLITIDQEMNELSSENQAAAVKDWIGGVPAATLEAIKIGKLLKKATKEANLTPVLVGHSHGGGMAQAGAAANGIKGIAFNSRPMGAGVRRYIGQSKVAKNAKHITTFSGRGDWLSGCVAINTMAVIFERLTGIPVPRSAGTGYHLPELSENNHCDIHGAFKKLKDME